MYRIRRLLTHSICRMSMHNIFKFDQWTAILMPSWPLFLLMTFLLKYRYHHTPRGLIHCWGGDEETCRRALWNMKRIGKKEPPSTEELKVKLAWVFLISAWRIIVQECNHLSQDALWMGRNGWEGSGTCLCLEAELSPPKSLTIRYCEKA